ncbi:MAG: transcription termination/antitermination protein NusG [Nitrospiria bacterium]
MKWYVVNTKPLKEYIAEATLKQLGLETFFPKFKEKRVIRRKYQTVIGPLFPGYFFVRFDVETHYRAVHYAHGVRGVVASGSAPAEMSETEILMIRSRLEEGDVVPQQSSFRPGQAVRIQKGPFEGLEAVFEREMTAQHRVVLLLKTLMHQPQVVVDRDCVAVFSV